MRTAGSVGPGIVTAIQSRMHWRATVVAAAGRSSSRIADALSASQRVTAGRSAAALMGFSLRIRGAVGLAKRDLVDLRSATAEVR